MHRLVDPSIAKFRWLHFIDIILVSYSHNTNSHAGKPFGSWYRVMDVKEERSKRERERYGRMTNEEKQEQLKKRREAYQQNKKNTKRDQDPRTKRCAQERQRYANKQPEQKKARIEQITANKTLKRRTPCKDSIAMENPAYIATEEEVGPSTLNVRQRKPVTPGERQTLLQRRNGEFSKKKRKTVSVSSEEDTSVMNNNNDTQPIKPPQVMIRGNTLYFIQYLYIKKYIMYN